MKELIVHNAVDSTKCIKYTVVNMLGVNYYPFDIDDTLPGFLEYMYM